MRRLKERTERHTQKKYSQLSSKRQKYRKKKRRLLRHLENTVRCFNMLWLRLRIKIREYKVGYI